MDADGSGIVSSDGSPVAGSPETAQSCLSGSLLPGPASRHAEQSGTLLLSVRLQEMKAETTLITAKCFLLLKCFTSIN